MLNETHWRFSSNACSILMGVAALNPKHSAFLDKTALSGMAANYGAIEDDLTTEVSHLKRRIVRKKEQGQEASTPMDFAIMVEPYKDVFIDLYKLACIAVTLPVTSAACEKSSSCLKFLKTYWWNSSGNSGTSNLAVISINSRGTKQ